MKKLIWSFSLLFPLLSGWAQSMDRSVIGSAGNVAGTSKITLEWTLGEPAVQSFSHPGGFWQEGFHQAPIVILPTAEPDLTTAVPKPFLVFPNPSSAWVKVKANAFAGEGFRLEITDAHGRPLVQKDYRDGIREEDINLQPLPSGLYQLFIRDDQHRILQVIRLVKQ